MKAKLLINISAILLATLLAPICHAIDITATNSGNWSNTNIWSTQSIPGPADTVDIPAGVNVTVDTNAMVAYIYDSGTVTMGPNSTLILLQDPMISPTTTLNATATGSTVIYTGNPYNAIVCNYYNLVLANTNWTPPTSPYVNHYEDFNNFASASVSTATPMTIYGNMTVQGYIKVQEANVAGVPITVNGNLTIGTGCYWDCSSGSLTVGGNLFLNGLLEDLDGAHGSNYVNGSVIVSGPATGGRVWYPSGTYTNGWYLGDVVTWGVGGGLTNNGAIYGIGFASIFFNGTGTLAGSNTLTIPTMTVVGTYTIDDTIKLTTNNADLFGTLIFDLANTNQIDLIPYSGATTTQTTYYNGNLVVINTGPAPTAGKTYTLFQAANYAGAFSSETLPGLPGGLNWNDNLSTSGSLVVGGSAGKPVITVSRTGNQLSLSWDSATFPGYSVQAQTNRNGLGTNWVPTGNTTSPYSVTINPTNPAVFYRLSNP